MATGGMWDNVDPHRIDIDTGFHISFPSVPISFWGMTTGIDVVD